MIEEGQRILDCTVSDGREWQYVRVVGTDLRPCPTISSEDVGNGIERFAATLPAEDRIRHLLNANQLHIDSDGTVSN